MGLENKKLALFFTCGISLDTWERIGIFTREIQPYNLLARHFEKIYFITYGGERDLKFKDKLAKNIKILPRKIGLPPKIYQFLIPLIYRKELKESDFYKTNQMSASIPAILSKWLYKRKLVVRCGYEWLNLKEKEEGASWKLLSYFFLEKVAYRNADKILTTSFEDKKYIQTRFNTRSSHIAVIPNFIDTDLFKPINVRKRKNTICFIGRLSSEKNLFNLIKAISVLNLTLLIFGSGPLERDLKAFAHEMNATVEFKGNIPNYLLPLELNKADLFVLPSLHEGNPKALLEAMACGLPVIATRVKGITEIINHHVNGYLSATDAISIRESIIELIKNETLRKTLGENARKTILKSFKLDKTFQKEFETYLSL